MDNDTKLFFTMLYHDAFLEATYKYVDEKPTRTVPTITNFDLKRRHYDEWVQAMSLLKQ
jgi:hypothetical protein